MTSTTKEKLLELISERDNMETKISEFGIVLETNGNVGMNGLLIDGEGFPRSDINIQQVRHARQQIICLQNDFKEITKQIEELLHKLHLESGNAQDELVQRAGNIRLENTIGPNSNGGRDENEPLRAIVKVNLVSPGSPGENAGLCFDDEIIEFGSINSKNFTKNLEQIGTLVRHKQNQRISLKVRRNGQIMDIILIPKTWSGHGLLGCNIVLTDI